MAWSGLELYQGNCLEKIMSRLYPGNYVEEIISRFSHYIKKWSGQVSQELYQENYIEANFELYMTTRWWSLKL